LIKHLNCPFILINASLLGLTLGGLMLFDCIYFLLDSAQIAPDLSCWRRFPEGWDAKRQEECGYERERKALLCLADFRAHLEPLGNMRQLRTSPLIAQFGREGYECQKILLISCSTRIDRTS